VSIYVTDIQGEHISKPQLVLEVLSATSCYSVSSSFKQPSKTAAYNKTRDPIYLGSSCTWGIAPWVASRSAHFWLFQQTAPRAVKKNFWPLHRISSKTSADNPYIFQLQHGCLSMSLSWWQWHRITDFELSHSSLLAESLIWPRMQISVLWFFPEFHWFRNQSYRLHTLLHASPCRSGTDIVAPLLINVTAPTIQQEKLGQGTSLLLKTLSSTLKTISLSSLEIQSVPCTQIWELCDWSESNFGLNLWLPQITRSI